MEIKRKLNAQLSFAKETLEDFAWKGKKLKRKSFGKKKRIFIYSFPSAEE